MSFFGARGGATRARGSPFANAAHARGGGAKKALSGQGNTRGLGKAGSETADGDNAGDGASQRFENANKRRAKERVHAIEKGFLADPNKPRTLAEAITPVGTCPGMCAEYERLERIVQNDVWGPEQGDDGTPDESRMVKKFRRAAAGIDEQLPSDLRPPAVLKKTIDYLFDRVIGTAASLASVHHFVWDRTRAIRNDFSIQQITKSSDVEIAIACYERIARFHILSLHQFALPEKPYERYDWYQEREQLDRTLLSLAQYYDDNRGKPACRNEAEFRAYAIIFQIQSPSPDMEERLNGWTPQVKTHPRVQVALGIYAAASSVLHVQGPLKPFAPYPVARQDWNAFFGTIESRRVSYLMACVAEIYFNIVRTTILTSICRALKRQGSTNDIVDVTLGRLTEIMRFDDTAQTRAFCTSHGLGFKRFAAKSGEEYLDFNTFTGKTLPKPKTALSPQTFSDIVERKRFARSLPAVMNGLSYAQAKREGSLVAEEKDMSLNASVSSNGSNSGSLFIGRGPSMPEAMKTAAPQTFASPFAAANNIAASNPFAAVQMVPAEVATVSSNPFAHLGSGSGVSSSSNPFAPKLPSPFQTASNTTAQSGPFAPTAPPASPFSQEASRTSAQPSASLQDSVFANKSASTNPFALTKPSSGLSSFQQPQPQAQAQAQAQSIPQKSFSWSQNPASSFGSASTSKPSVADSIHASRKFTWTSPSTTVGQPSLASIIPQNDTKSPSAPSAPSAPLFNFAPISNGANTVQKTSSESAPQPFGSLFPSQPGSTSLFAPTPTASEQQKLAAHADPWSQSASRPAEASLPSSSFGAPAASLEAGVPKSQDASQAIDTPQPSESSPFLVKTSPVETSKTVSTPKPLFQNAQFNQPKKPSPLSKTFTAPSDAAHSPPPQSSTTPVNTPPPLSKLINRSQVAPGKVLQRLAREILLDSERGLLQQFVEHHARSMIMSVYDQITLEDDIKTADAFRHHTLAVRFGKRWRQVSWSLTLHRQAKAKRERRRNTARDKQAKEQQLRHREKVNAVDDFLASRVGRTEDELMSSRLGSSTMSHNSTNLAQSRLSARVNGARAITEDRETHSPDKSSDRRVDHGRIIKPVDTPASSKSFLGFRVSSLNTGSTSKPSASRSTYFRMKAMGLLTTGTPIAPPNLRKRAREDDDVDAVKVSPAYKKSRTPPRSVRSEHSGSHGSRSSPFAPSSPGAQSLAPSRPASKTEQEDEQLFARARAARQALADSADWYRHEVRNADDTASVRSVSSSVQCGFRMSVGSTVVANIGTDAHADSWLNDSSVRNVPAYRLRESRFVPREHYGKAVEKARQKIESRTASRPVTGQLDDHWSQMHQSTPVTDLGILHQDAVEGVMSSHEHLLPHAPGQQDDAGLSSQPQPDTPFISAPVDRVSPAQQGGSESRSVDTRLSQPSNVSGNGVNISVPTIAQPDSSIQVLEESPTLAPLTKVESSPHHVRRRTPNKPASHANAFALLAENSDGADEADEARSQLDGSVRSQSGESDPSSDEIDPEDDEEEEDMEQSFVNNAELQDSASDYERRIVSHGSGPDAPQSTPDHHLDMSSADRPGPDRHDPAGEQLHGRYEGDEAGVSDAESQGTGEVDGYEDEDQSALDDDDELDDDDDNDDDDDDDEDVDGEDGREEYSDEEGSDADEDGDGYAEFSGPPVAMNASQLQESGLVKAGTGTADDALELSD